jgi:hypothetical protein
VGSSAAAPTGGARPSVGAVEALGAPLATRAAATFETHLAGARAFSGLAARTASVDGAALHDAVGAQLEGRARARRGPGRRWAEHAFGRRPSARGDAGLDARPERVAADLVRAARAACVVDGGARLDVPSVRHRGGRRRGARRRRGIAIHDLAPLARARRRDERRQQDDHRPSEQARALGRLHVHTVVQLRPRANDFPMAPTRFGGARRTTCDGAHIAREARGPQRRSDARRHAPRRPLW